MSKMVIFNCPAYRGFTRDIPDWLDNTNCGYYTGQVPCQDYTNCVMKQIVQRCKKVRECTADICTNPYEYATYCETRGVLELLDIQEVE